MRKIILSSVVLAGLCPAPAAAWTCADGTCTGPGWAGSGFGHFSGAGADPEPQRPVIIIVPPPRPVYRPRPVYPRGYDQDTGQCYDLDAC